MNRTAPRPRQQAGLSLLELLIAMTLGLLLLGGLLTVYSASSLSYRVAENTNRMQEGARHAFSIIGQHVRSAGYLGCFSGPTGPTNLAVPNIAFTPQTYLVGHEAIGVGNHDGTLAGNAAVAGTYPYVAGNHGAGNSGTDALTTRRASINGILLNDNVNTRQPPIPIRANTLGLANNDYVLVGDCDGADLICAVANTFSVALNASATQACTGNTTSPLELSRNYRSGTAPYVRALEETTFHVRLNPANQPALYQRSRVGGVPQTQELVEGVQDMQLCFGEDTTTDPPDRSVDVYRTANTVANWANVISVRVTLLMRSLEDGIANTPQAYGIDRNCDGVVDAGETLTPTDRRVRRAFTNTFSVRNRLP